MNNRITKDIRSDAASKGSASICSVLKTLLMNNLQALQRCFRPEDAAALLQRQGLECSVLKADAKTWGQQALQGTKVAAMHMWQHQFQLTDVQAGSDMQITISCRILSLCGRCSVIV